MERPKGTARPERFATPERLHHPVILPGRYWRLNMTTWSYEMARAKEDALIRELFAIVGEKAPVVQFKPQDLRQPCGPHEDLWASGMHKHQCPRCKTLWKHDDAVQGASREQFEEAHTCEGCGEHVTEKVWEF